MTAHSGIRTVVSAAALLAACQTPNQVNAVAPAAPPHAQPMQALAAPTAEPTAAPTAEPTAAPTASSSVAAPPQTPKDAAANAVRDTANTSSGQGRLSTGDGMRRGPQVRIGKLRIVSGTEDEALVARALRSSYGQFRLCYESALSRSAKLEAQFTVRFQLGSDGKGSQAKLSSGKLADAPMLSCVLAAFEHVQLEVRERPDPDTVVIEAPLLPVRNFGCALGQR